MKNRNPKDAVINGDKSEGSKSVYNKKKNMKRFGRQGRSLEKSTNSYYNPSVISMKALSFLQFHSYFVKV